MVRGAALISFLTSRLPGASRPLTIALHVSESHIGFLATEGEYAVGWGSRSLADEIVNGGRIIDPQALANAIDSLLSKVNPLQAQIVLCVSGTRSLPRIVKIPAIEKRLVEGAIRYEAERQLPVPVDDLYLSYLPIDSLDSEAGYYIVGVPRSIIDTHVKTLELTKFKRYYVDLKGLALARSINRSDGLIADVSDSTVDIVIVAQGVPVMMRSVPIGSESLPVKEKARQASAVIQSSIQYHNKIHPIMIIGNDTPIYLTGRYATEELRDATASEGIRNPIEFAPSPLKHPENFPAQHYASNLGMAIKFSGKYRQAHETQFPATHMDILPNQMAGIGSVLKLAVLGLIALILLLSVAPMAMLDSDRKAEAAEVHERIVSLSRELEDVRLISKAVRKAQQETTRLKEETTSVLETDIKYATELDLVYRSTPNGMTIIDAAFSKDKVSIEGEASQRSQIINYAATIEQADQFGSVQAVAITESQAKDGQTTLRFSLEALR